MKTATCLGVLVFVTISTAGCASGSADASQKIRRSSRDAGPPAHTEEQGTDANFTPAAAEDAGTDAEVVLPRAEPDAGMETPPETPPDPAHSPPPPDDPPPDYDRVPGPMCTTYVARSDAPWTLVLASFFLCDSECAALVGEAYLGDGMFPWSWSYGPIVRSEGGDFRFDLRELPPGTYRVSYIIPSEGCDAAIGTAGPGPMCVDGGPWAAYRDGAEVCEPNRSWVWCEDAPDGTGYTCSLMFAILDDGTVIPAGNR